MVVDGGNSRWTDDQANAELLAEKGIGFVDCGVSGGVWGLENGYALMYGGDADDVAKVQPAFDALKPEGEFGCVHAGKVGAGHFSKMVHNGIEYAIMQAYAEGWELLEKADLVDNVTEVFRSWREGTVIRSWLLDLLVAALDEDAEPDQDRAATPRTPARAAGPSRPASRTPSPTPAITAALFARFVSRQDDCPAMKAVAAMRNQFGGHAVTHRGAARRRRRRPAGRRADASRRVHVAHLTLHDFRSYADARRPAGPGATAFIGRNGQGKTNLVEAIDYLSRLASHRVAARRAAGQGRRRPGAGARRGRPRRPQRCSRSRSTPAVQPRPGQPVPAPPRPRADRPGAHRGLLARRPGPGQGRPRRPARGSSTTCWCCARRGWPAYAPTTTGSCKQRNSLLKTAGAARRGSSWKTAHCRRSAVWDAHLARTGAELLAERLRWSPSCGPTSARPTQTVARGAEQRRRGPGVPALLELPEPATGPRDLDRPAAAPSSSAGGDELDRGVSLVGPHRDELLLPSATAATRLPVRGYASHGESWSFALALRLASYDLLRADGDDPILILDDVFAELDAERRAQLAELVAGAEQVLVTAAVAADVPEALAGTRFVVAGRGGYAVTSERAGPPASRNRQTRPAGDRPRTGARRRRPRPGSPSPAEAPAGAARMAPRKRSASREARKGEPSGAHPDDRDPQTSTSPRPAGRRPGWEHRPQGARRLRALARPRRRRVGAALQARSRTRTGSCGPHRLHRLGDPAAGCSRRPSYAASTRSSGTARSP